MNNKIIFLDTCIFIGEGIIRGRKINQLAKLGSLNYISLKISSITYREVLGYIEKNTPLQIAQLKNLHKEYQKKCTLLKALDIYSFDFSNAKRLETSNVQEKLLKKFNDFIEYAKIEIIEVDENFNISELLNSYFEGTPPFKNPKKKNEFPDAISLQIIEKWSKKNNCYVDFITSDSDFDEVNITEINIIKGLSNGLEKILSEVDIDSLSDEKSIFTSLKSSKINIEEEVKLTLKDEFIYELQDEFASEEIEFDFIIFPKIISLKLENSLWIDEDKKLVTLNFRGIAGMEFILDDERLSIYKGFDIDEYRKKYDITIGKRYYEMFRSFELVFYYYYNHPYLPNNNQISLDYCKIKKTEANRVGSP